MEYFNSSDYSEIVEKMEKCLEYYEKMTFKNNKYSLYLANGEILNVIFLPENIPHLLGLKVEMLKRYNFVKNSMSSYDCLKYFLENNYSILQKLRKENIPYEKIFSEYINEKLDNFINIINIRTDDLEYIIKYDNEKTYQIEDHSEISDYYIVRRKNGVYSILGLIKDSENNTFCRATSSRKYENEKDLNEFINRLAKKQDLTYCYLLKVRNSFHKYENSFSLKLEERMELLNKIIDLSSKTDSTCSVVNDYLYTLNKLKNEKTNSSTSIEVLKLLSGCIKSGNVLDSNILTEVCGNIELNNDVINLINICNDLVCSTESSNELAQTNYSKLNEENISLKQELEQLKKQLTESESKNEQLLDENKSLSEQNNSYQQDMNILKETYIKVFQK